MEKPKTEKDSRVKEEMADDSANKQLLASMEKCSVVLNRMDVEKYFESSEATSMESTSKSPSSRSKRAAKTAAPLLRPRFLRHRTILPQPGTSNAKTSNVKTKTAVKKTLKNVDANVVAKKNRDSVIVIDDSDDEIEDNKVNLKTEIGESSTSKAKVPNNPMAFVSGDGERPASVLSAEKEQQGQSMTVQILNVFINVVEKESATDPQQIGLTSVGNSIRETCQYMNQQQHVWTAAANRDGASDEILVGTVTVPEKSPDNILETDTTQRVCVTGASQTAGNEAATGPRNDEHSSQICDDPSANTSVNQDLVEDSSTEDEFDRLVNDKIKVTSLSFISSFREPSERSLTVIDGQFLMQSMDSSMVSGRQETVFAAAAPTAVEGESSYAGPEITDGATAVAVTKTNESDEHISVPNDIAVDEPTVATVFTLKTEITDEVGEIVAKSVETGNATKSADLDEAPNFVELTSSGVPVAPTTPVEPSAIVVPEPATSSVLNLVSNIQEVPQIPAEKTVEKPASPIQPVTTSTLPSMVESVDVPLILVSSPVETEAVMVDPNEASVKVTATDMSFLPSANLGEVPMEADIIETIVSGTVETDTSEILVTSSIPSESSVLAPLKTAESNEHMDISNNGNVEKMAAEMAIEKPVSSIPNLDPQPVDVSSSKSAPENHQKTLPSLATASMTSAENDPKTNVMQPKEALQGFPQSKKSTILPAGLGGTSIASNVLDASTIPAELDELALPLQAAASADPMAISNNETKLKITTEKAVEKLFSSILNIERQSTIVSPSRVSDNDQHVVPMILNADAVSSQAKVVQPKEAKESVSNSETSIVSSIKLEGTSVGIASEILAASPIPPKPSRLTAFEAAASSSLTVTANNGKVPAAQAAIKKSNSSNAIESHSSIRSIEGHLQNVQQSTSPNFASTSANLKKNSDANVAKSNQESVPPTKTSIAAPIVANRFSLGMPSPMKRFLVKPKTKSQNDVAADASFQEHLLTANFAASANAGRRTSTPNENASAKIKVNLARQNVPTPAESKCSVSIKPRAKVLFKAKAKSKSTDKAANDEQPKRKDVREILTASGVFVEKPLILPHTGFFVAPLAAAPHGFSVEWNTDTDHISTAPRPKKRVHVTASAKTQKAPWVVDHLFDNFDTSHLGKRPRLSNEFDMISNPPVRNLVAPKTRPKRIHDILRMGKIRWLLRQRLQRLKH